MLTALKRFLAGFVSTLAFHQTAVAALWAAGIIPRTPFSMDPVPPLGVPQVVSIAFWGGVWGIFLVGLASRLPRRWRWPIALAVGATATTLVAWYVVAPLKGRPAPGGPGAFGIGLFINGMWALGTLLIARLLEHDPSARLPGASASAQRP